MLYESNFSWNCCVNPHFQVTFDAPPKRLFDVTLEDVVGGGRVLKVGFYGKLPPPNVVDRILRESLDHAILIYPTVDILATGFLGEDTLSSDQYSGSLDYKASQKKVISFDEYSGVKHTTSSSSRYFVEVEENKTYPGIKPVRKLLTVTIVYPQKPLPEIGTAYNAIYVEIQKLAARGLDVNAYVSVGNSKIKTSWQQIKDRNVAYIFAEYKSVSKKLMRKGKLLNH